MTEPVPFEAISNAPSRTRNLLLRRLIDFVALPTSSVAPQDRAMGGDILLDMLLHATDEERALCGRRLAAMSEAPRRLLRYIAQCSFDIAQPVLEQNESFDASDLCQILERVSSEHRVVIAGRKSVPPAVCDRLVTVGEIQALRVLLKNKGACLPEQAIDILVGRSRKEDDLCPLIIKRPELRPAQAMAMFWWADGPTRRIILQRFAAERLELIEMCADIFAIAAEEGWSDPVARKTLQSIERRQRNRDAIDKSPYESLEHAVQMASENGMSPELAQEIGYLAGVKPVTIAKLISDTGGEGLAVLCKATGLKRAAMTQLWQSLKRPLELDDGQPSSHFDFVMETFDILSVAKAQTALRYWNWALSSSFSPTQLKVAGMDQAEANDETAFSTSQRTAGLVFGR